MAYAASDFPQWQVVYKYCRQWNEQTSEDEISLFEQALKKWGSSNAYQP